MTNIGFVDWCITVLEAVLEANKELKYRREGIPTSVLADRFFGEGQYANVDISLFDVIELSPDTPQRQRRKALLQALQTLGAEVPMIGSTARPPDGLPNKWKPGSLGELYRDYLQRYFFEIWANLCAHEFSEEQQQVLLALNKLSHKRENDVAWLEPVAAEGLRQSLGWPDDDDHRELLLAIVEELAARGFAKADVSQSGRKFCSNYNGIAWQEKQISIWTPIIDALVRDWETTSVDFKRELYTNTKDEKIELVKDLLGLANTRVSGERWLIVGFDDKTHEYFGPPVPKITQNHLEQLISLYISPNLQIRYKCVDYPGGQVGMLQVLPEKVDLPYAVSQSLQGGKKKMNVGDWFVRHGTHTEPPTASEVKSITDTALYAKAMNQS